MGNNNFQVPPNTSVRVQPMNEGKDWRWEVRAWGKKLGEGGPFKTRAQAAKAGWENLAKLLQPRAERSATNSYFMQRLLYWTKARPYVVMHVAERLTHGGAKSETVRDARAEELARWTRQEGVPGRPEIPSHGRAKLPGEVAASVFDLMTKIGLTGVRADRWARRMIGAAYAAPEAASHLDMDDANDQALAAEYDDESETAMTRDSPV